jgi:hypothetical protein
MLVDLVREKIRIVKLTPVESNKNGTGSGTEESFPSSSLVKRKSPIKTWALLSPWLFKVREKFPCSPAKSGVDTKADRLWSNKFPKDR